MTSKFKIGDKVRTVDPLTSGGVLSPSERVGRVPGACGTVRRYCFGLWWRVEHEDGTTAAYDAAELVPVEATDEQQVNAAINRDRWIKMGLNGGRYMEPGFVHSADRENYLLNEHERLTEVIEGARQALDECGAPTHTPHGRLLGLGGRVFAMFEQSLVEPVKPVTRPKVSGFHQRGAGGYVVDDHGQEAGAVWQCGDGWGWQARRALLPSLSAHDAATKDEAQAACLAVLRTWADVEGEQGPRVLQEGGPGEVVATTPAPDGAEVQDALPVQVVRITHSPSSDGPPPWWGAAAAPKAIEPAGPLSLLVAVGMCAEQVDIAKGGPWGAIDETPFAPGGPGLWLWSGRAEAERDEQVGGWDFIGEWTALPLPVLPAAAPSPSLSLFGTLAAMVREAVGLEGYTDGSQTDTDVTVRNLREAWLAFLAAPDVRLAFGEAVTAAEKGIADDDARCANCGTVNCSSEECEEELA